ncbi:chloroplast photosystem II protein PsbS [Chloropicon primus]|uniref:Chloroplast photosystem II protein PsbS n=2 Tax=Chloropicon primus TaxID=1764295 RepID=A0A5B8MEG8_9CHLO|nr:chloroplast photosystem II protein PsbS [Chloropicon primus]UPQ97964.1 chloroplast photosystem II protein PsbS [Chloropicon primus]|eukprot:QDZ18757.1 chloroplast photosystem II protein PsbS [Chloropicon primus]
MQLLKPKTATKKAAPAPAPKRSGAFSFGSRPKAPKKVAKVAEPQGPAAQSFQVRIPGQFFQAKNDIVWNVSLGFTKSNELFVGRMAMLGFAASLVGEILTGKGALAQFDIETGLPLMDTEPLVLGLAAFNLFAAFAPGKGKFIPDAEESSERPAGSLQDANISILNPGKFLGIEGVGFTKANELFVGRMAQLGFAASLIGEAVTGKGPLAQFNLETGIPLSEAEPLLLFSIIFFALTAVNEGTGKFVDEE